MKAHIYKVPDGFYINDGSGQSFGPWETKEAAKSEWPRIKRNRDKRERHQVMADMGLSRVRGALGGVYYE